MEVVEPVLQVVFPVSERDNDGHLRRRNDFVLFCFQFYDEMLFTFFSYHLQNMVQQ